MTNKPSLQSFNGDIFLELHNEDAISILVVYWQIAPATSPVQADWRFPIPELSKTNRIICLGTGISWYLAKGGPRSFVLDCRHRNEHDFDSCCNMIHHAVLSSTWVREISDECFSKRGALFWFPRRSRDLKREITTCRDHNVAEK